MIPTEEELQAATYASLRAHPISEQATALVSTLAAMLETTPLRRERGRTSARAPPRNWTMRWERSLRTYCERMAIASRTPNPWVYRSMHTKSFNGASVSYRTFGWLVDGLTQLGFIQHVEGHRVDSEDRGKFAARFRATPALLAFCSDRAVDPAKVHDHFEFEYDLPTEVVELRATKEGRLLVEDQARG